MNVGDVSFPLIQVLGKGHMAKPEITCETVMEILLQAQEHPERYGNLMVRVAGYSAPFTSLWGDLQDEIIARTEHVVGGC
jgi:autonomous glycyl radical cofactor GrcA